MTLEDIVATIPDFGLWLHVEKIKLFGWYLHTSQNKAAFSGSDINACYRSVHLEPPTSISPVLLSLEQKRPKQLLRDKAGYRLERSIRQDFDARYGVRSSAIHVSNLLSGLILQISSKDQREYLDEAFICFQHKAFRAAIIMAWNLAFDRLCHYVIDNANHLSAFNGQLPKSFPKAKVTAITKRDDFYELKESEVLQVCKSSSIINGNISKVLKEKLDRRNLAAHPSGISFSQLTAEEFIKDLVENVILKLV
jgi:hypothetical protein